MNIHIENGIMVIEDAFDEQYTSRLIEWFEQKDLEKKTFERDIDSLRFSKRKDTSCMGNPFPSDDVGKPMHDLIRVFNEQFWGVYYPEYIKRYPVLETIAPISILDYKLQKTEPKGGYHIWHSERGNTDSSQRMGVYTLYLNDVEEGGETEFLQLSRRVPAKRGTLCVFPADYLYTHRGNPPLSGVKYLMTGWLEYR